MTAKPITRRIVTLAVAVLLVASAVSAVGPVQARSQPQPVPGSDTVTIFNENVILFGTVG